MLWISARLRSPLRWHILARTTSRKLSLQHIAPPFAYIIFIYIVIVIIIIIIVIIIMYVDIVAQLEMRYCLKKLLSKGNPSGPVKVRQCCPPLHTLSRSRFCHLLGFVAAAAHSFAALVLCVPFTLNYFMF